MTDAARWHDVAYEQTDIPAGLTIRDADRGNRGNMLRAAAFVDPDGPRRWELEQHTHRLSPQSAMPATDRSPAIR